VAVFADWAHRFILFHNKRQPREMGLAEVGQFFECIARGDKDPVVAFDASRAALDLLYRDVLHLDLGELLLPRTPYSRSSGTSSGSASAVRQAQTPLDVLDATSEEVQAAVATTRRLAGLVGLSP